MILACVACSSSSPGAVRLVSGSGASAIKGAKDPAPLETKMDIGTISDEASPMTLIDGVVYKRKPDLVNILLLGVDKDSNRREIGRSDMIMLVTLDMNNKTINCLTIPRDTHATVYHLDSDGNIESEVYEKLNHAYAYGLGPNKYSAENAMLCTSKFLSMGGELDVPIDYYISIDLDGLSRLADVFGGVEVTLDQDIPAVGSKGETVNLQGVTVRHYLENRHDMSEGEVTRQKHEQTFLKALLREIQEVGAAHNAGELYNVFTKFVRTNLTLPQVLEYAQILDGVSLDEISFDRISGEGITENGVWYLEPDMDEAMDLVLKSQYERA